MVEHLNDGMSASRNSNIAPGSRLNHVLDVKRVIALEQAIAADGTSLSSLMERAGCALADEVRARLPRPACVAVLAGSGNNGGDGWVCARALAEAGWPVTLVSPMEADEIAAEPARSAALEAKARAKQLDLPLSLLIAPSPEELAEQLSGAHVVVDAILGTGFSGMQVREPYATWIELANARCFPTDLEPSRGHAAEADAGGKAQGARRCDHDSRRRPIRPVRANRRSGASLHPRRRHGDHARAQAGPACPRSGAHDRTRETGAAGGRR